MDEALCSVDGVRVTGVGPGLLAANIELGGAVDRWQRRNIDGLRRRGAQGHAALPLVLFGSEASQPGTRYSYMPSRPPSRPKPDSR